MSKLWKVYLSGEVHSDWREEIIGGVEQEKLPVEFYGPVTDHGNSDKCGADILGNESEKFWYDHKGAKLNAIRTRNLIEEADIVVVRFGDKYKQWNAAFEAGYAAALNTPYIVQHAEDDIHALKEVDASALAVCETVDQIVRIIKYVIAGKLK